MLLARGRAPNEVHLTGIALESILQYAVDNVNADRQLVSRQCITIRRQTRTVVRAFQPTRQEQPCLSRMVSDPIRKLAELRKSAWWTKT